MVANRMSALTYNTHTLAHSLTHSLTHSHTHTHTRTHTGAVFLFAGAMGYAYLVRVRVRLG